ncbi:hypothetical protein J2Z49_000765 [Desulfofundulus luciae]|uniref:Uncharacterized protein n=1 Tax=Desulfofundulus luciae TaxID=74702 RepID=A0ABU0AYV7_9FIRM|nr:hypothetical protein [Desulfofundulus luciae]MDQ0285661.1 hypothetical protein [Desulfofundulus luciae]
MAGLQKANIKQPAGLPGKAGQPDGSDTSVRLFWLGVGFAVLGIILILTGASADAGLKFAVAVGTLALVVRLFSRHGFAALMLPSGKANSPWLSAWTSSADLYPFQRKSRFNWTFQKPPQKRKTCGNM